MQDYHQAVFHYSPRNKHYSRKLKGRNQLLHEYFTTEAEDGYSFVALIGQPGTEETGAHVLALTQETRSAQRPIPGKEQGASDD